MLFALVSVACGPFAGFTSNPFVFHFYQEEESPSIAERQKKENVALWQKSTSESISPKEIEAAVYDMSLQQLRNEFESGRPSNAFLAWIVRNDATEIKDFLLLAKELEELRVHRKSAWYFPADKKERFESHEEAEKFHSILVRCRKHTSGFLSDRYGLQYVRALMDLHMYDDCFDFYRKTMSTFPDGNLFKNMAKGYLAGCLHRMGKPDEANRMFAELGDFNSIMNGKKPYFKALVENNPESDVIKSRLNHWIGYDGRAENLIFIDVADAALSSPKVINRGDWLYLKAYVEEIYNRNHKKALELVRRALDQSFSRALMRHDAELMELCLSAGQSEVRNDLGHYVDKFQSEKRPLFFYVVPALLKQGRVSEAILLANFASSIKEYHEDSWTLPNRNHIYHEVDNDTYANTGFQLMLSRSAQEIADYKKFLTSRSAIVKKVIDRIRHDDDYLDEIIGTLYMREGNYDKAVEYLSRVSTDYQKSMNLYGCGYLDKNPWVDCYMPADKWAYPEKKEDVEESLRSTFYPENSSRLLSPDDAKLNFAKGMSKLQHAMKTGSADERGLARIRYALARFNSYNDCWALTRYWDGNANQCNYKPFYWEWDGNYRELDYLIELTGPIPTKEWLECELRKGLAELKSPEAIAEAEFLRRNYKTVAKHYPSTKVGNYLASHCDSWSDWL